MIGSSWSGVLAPAGTPQPIIDKVRAEVLEALRSPDLSGKLATMSADIPNMSAAEFGAFVECTPGNEGLCHISELADFRVRRTEDVVKQGDSITVKCIGIDERTGKVRLSRKAALKELEAQKPAEAAAPAAQ